MNVAKARAARTRDALARYRYAIGAAAELAGVEVETLRMWERRYGLVVAHRSDGGHRLYSEDDIQLVRATRRLVESGMRVGVVAKLPRARILAEAGKLPAAPAPPAAPAGPPGPAGPATKSSPMAPAAVVEEIIAAASAFDGARVAALLDAPRLTLDAHHVLQDVYLPLMRRVGELWENGALPVAVEHFLEKLVTSRLHALLQATPQPKKGPVVLCACPPHERHEIGLLAACVDLRAAGVATAFLGADVPVSDLVSAAKTLAPAAVLLATTITLPPRIASSLGAAVTKQPLSRVPLFVGGRNASALAASLRRQVIAVEQILGAAPRIRALLHVRR